MQNATATRHRGASTPTNGSKNPYLFIDPDLEEEFVGCMALAAERAANGSDTAIYHFSRGLELDLTNITTESYRLVLQTLYDCLQEADFPSRAILRHRIREQYGPDSKLIFVFERAVMNWATHIAAIPRLVDSLTELASRRKVISEAESAAWSP